MLAQIEHLDGLARTAHAPAWRDIREEIQARIDEWGALLNREPAIARQILRKLLSGRIVITAKTDDAVGWYEFEGEASYGRLLEGIVPGGRSKAVVPPG